MGSHQSRKMLKDEWLTPPRLIKALGAFDLDPCAPVVRPWDTATNHYTIEDSGLMQSWFGRVWLNPPYGNQTGLWLNKLAAHGDGIALIFARTETEMFFNEVWDRASACFFVKGRIRFYHVDGSKPKGNGSGAPSVLIAYGINNMRSLRDLTIPGKYIHLRG